MNRQILKNAAALVAVAMGACGTAQAEEASNEAGLNLEQARREVRLADDLYKTAIVFMNDVYVEDENSVAAGETAKHLFDAMKSKGWHEARLIDATGEPLNDENAPQAGFEKKAIQKILKGETYYDEVVTEGDQKFPPRRDTGAGGEQQVRDLPSGQQGGWRDGSDQL